jgi:outer membrane protein assembly factor BamA
LFGQKDFQLKTDSVTAKPVVSVVPALGYTLQSKLAITLAGNIAFRLSPRTKISTIIINVAYTQTKQIIVPIQSSIWTNNNDYNYVGDIRYLKYPESTYGLGSNSNIANNDPMDYSFFRFYETVLKRISGNFFAGAGYVLDVHWNVTHEGPLNGAVSDYANYADPNKTVSSGITLNSLFDNRDNSINPSKGFYAALQYRDNKGFLGSTRNWQSLVVDIRKYYKLPATSNNVLALWSYNWLVLGGKPPYVDLPSNTWDTFSGTGRGYIQGRFRGAQMVYLESEYRFKISANGLFGGVVFVNAQSFSAMQGTLLQSVQPAFGPGLRIKVNKISKTNIAIDYGIGRQGSRGVFINVGEVF